MIRRGDIVVVELDPAVGTEMQKTRPCVVVSPDELNEHLTTVLIVPLTSGGPQFVFRPRLTRSGRVSSVAIDQMRAVDRRRVVSRVGSVNARDLANLLRNIQDMFAP